MKTHTEILIVKKHTCREHQHQHNDPQLNKQPWLKRAAQ